MLNLRGFFATWAIQMAQIVREYCWIPVGSFPSSNPLQFAGKFSHCNSLSAGSFGLSYLNRVVGRINASLFPYGVISPSNGVLDEIALTNVYCYVYTFLQQSIEGLTAVYCLLLAREKAMETGVALDAARIGRLRPQRRFTREIAEELGHFPEACPQNLSGWRVAPCCKCSR